MATTTCRGSPGGTLRVTGGGPTAAAGVVVVAAGPSTAVPTADAARTCFGRSGVFRFRAALSCVTAHSRGTAWATRCSPPRAMAIQPTRTGICRPCGG